MISEKRDADNQEIYERMLLWRGIDREGGDSPCSVCSGSGVRVYGNTTTWHGGVGGQTLTSGICDRCWGSGNAEKPWVNLRRISMTDDRKKWTDSQMDRMDAKREAAEERAEMYLRSLQQAERTIALLKDEIEAK
jgi:hypothetical protein